MATRIAVAPRIDDVALHREAFADRRSVRLGARMVIPVLLIAAWSVAAARSPLVPSIGATLDSLVTGFTSGNTARRCSTR